MRRTPGAWRARRRGTGLRACPEAYKRAPSAPGSSRGVKSSVSRVRGRGRDFGGALPTSAVLFGHFGGDNPALHPRPGSVEQGEQLGGASEDDVERGAAGG